MIDLHKTLDLKDVEADDFLNNLQGNILKPHGRQYTTLLLLTFMQQNYYLARAWLAQFAREQVTSAWKQKEDRDKDNKDNLFCMALLSAYGYVKLYGDDSSSSALPADIGFKLGMQSSLFSPAISDLWKNSGEIHAMILLAHDVQTKLKNFEDELKSQVRAFSTVEVEHGTKLPSRGNYQPGEHFGFADGISRPLFIHQDAEKYRTNAGPDLRWDPATPLNQVLVPEAQKHDDGSTTYGSYMVYYKIAQDPDLFKSMFNSDQAARVIGRKQDGTPLIPFVGSESNNFNYKDDPQGVQCPLNAHIRKANDRVTSPRIARRGITYDDGPKERGILFMSFQADLQGQFEPLLEQMQGDALASTEGLIIPVKGEYFYAPSIKSLQELATLRKDQQRRLNNALDTLIRDDDKLKKFGEVWDKDRYKASKDVGIVPDDLATVYSILRIGDEKVEGDISDGKNKLKEINDADPKPPKYDREKQKAAFQKLLFEPELLQQFIELWPNDPAQALNLVGLTSKDEQGLYEHCAERSMILNWRFWR